MKQYKVCSIQRGCVYDGSGMRTTLFFYGCCFKCPWCCNPEAIVGSAARWVDQSKCLKQKDALSPLCKDCVLNGATKSIDHCPFDVSVPTITSKTIDEIMQVVEQDATLYELSKGGVTLSGGEPLLYLSEMSVLIDRLREQHISIAIETTLYVKDKPLLSTIIPKISHWIVDLKIQTQVIKDDYLDVIAANLQLLRDVNSHITYRLVVIKDLTVDYVLPFLNKLEIDNLDIIKCHSLATTKYKKLQLDFVSYEPSADEFESFKRGLEKQGMEINVLQV